MPPSRPEHVGVDPPADEEADDAISTTTKKLRTRSASVRPTSTAERAIGSERNRSIRPLLQVLGEPDAGGERAEHDGLHEDARHQEVDVRTAPPAGRWIAPPNT